jgi:hypothetical protein
MGQGGGLRWRAATPRSTRGGLATPLPNFFFFCFFFKNKFIYLFFNKFILFY